MSTAALSRDPARYSYYVDDAAYLELIADFQHLRTEEPTVEDPAERDRFRRLIEREARLLDRAGFRRVDGRYTDECFYWVPKLFRTAVTRDARLPLCSMTGAGSGTASIVCRPALLGRKPPHHGPFEWCRTSRCSIAEPRTKARAFQFSFINEFWDNEIQILAGWAGHRFRRVNGNWKISAKQVNLLQCDQCIRNPSIIL